MAQCGISLLDHHPTAGLTIHINTLSQSTLVFVGWGFEKEHLLERLSHGVDQEFYRRTDSSEWMLDPCYFPEGNAGNGPISGGSLCIRLDLHELENSRGSGNRCPELTLDTLQGYAFPPSTLIRHCLAKIQREKVPELILIAPIWPIQPFQACSTGN